MVIAMEIGVRKRPDINLVEQRFMHLFCKFPAFHIIAPIDELNSKPLLVYIATHFSFTQWFVYQQPT